MNTVADVLKWIAYIICICAIGVYVFIVSMPCVSCGAWDYVVLPITTLVIPVVTLFFAYRWPIIAGEVLIAVALFIGWDIFATDFWAASLFSMPYLIAGFAFIVSGILLYFSKRSTR